MLFLNSKFIKTMFMQKESQFKKKFNAADTMQKRISLKLVRIPLNISLRAF